MAALSVQSDNGGILTGILSEPGKLPVKLCWRDATPDNNFLYTKFTRGLHGLLEQYIHTAA